MKFSLADTIASFIGGVIGYAIFGWIGAIVGIIGANVGMEIYNRNKGK